MLNDRFKSESKFDLKSKLRDKKFVSIVAIGIFVLILVIVLFARGCSSKPKTAPKPGAKKPVPTVQTNDKGTADNGDPASVSETDIQDENGSSQQDSSNEDERVSKREKLMQEGVKYKNSKNYSRAIKCFAEAEKLGAKGAGDLKQKCIKLANSQRKKSKKKSR